MDESFWHNRWQTNQTAWHERAVNPQLLKHFPALSLAKGSRVFVPLCGKSLDLGWLLSQGHAVAGAELSELAVRQLFTGLGMDPDMSVTGNFTRYSGKQIEIFVGNIFDLSRDLLGPVDAVYDRAALVALPAEMRIRYAAHLTALTDSAPQLLICYQYDQAAMDGPPFSIPTKELHRHYSQNYVLTLLEGADVPGGLKGKSPAMEQTWHLTRRTLSVAS